MIVGEVIAVRPDVNPPAIFVRITQGGIEIRAIKLEQYPDLEKLKPGDKIKLDNFENHPTSQF